MALKVTEPKTPGDFEKYYRLRWEVLRKPWNRPIGSEKDEQEKGSVHAFILDENKEVMAVGRLQFNESGEAQVRSMGVHDKCRRQNLGSKVLQYLEQKAKEKGVVKVVLDGREEAVNFYKKNGYVVTGESYILFGTIQHFRMQKLLNL